MLDAALNAETLWMRYGRRRPFVVCDVSLTIPTGSITALVGPNGAGKSTLIGAWMGFQRPSRGRVLVNGIDPWVNRSAAVNGTGYVPQASSLYRSLTVRDHVELAGFLRPGFDATVAQRHLIALGIGPDRRASELSGGQQAQLALAIALGTRAQVLILDEPLASLDPLARREFLRILVTEVRQSGSTALLSSHIVTDVQEACDRLVVVTAGRVRLSDTVDAAIAHHSIVTGSDGSAPAVGTFPDNSGERQTLVRSIPGKTPRNGRAATLEEIVLGYLASSEPTPSVERGWANR